MVLKKGLLVVFDGLDAAGKGAMLSMTADYLFNNHKEFDKILLTREPTFSPTGQLIRKKLVEDKDPMSDAKQLLNLYLEDRKQHLDEVIRPAISKGFIVLCDRYKYSTMAYQETQGIDLNSIIDAHKRLTVPDIVFLLDVEPETALQRIELDRGKIEKFEKIDFLSKLRQNYLKLKDVLKEENIVVIDANPSKEKVFNQIKPHLDEVLKQ